MTDRIHGLVVTLDRDVREDDAQPTIEAIRQIRRVIEVTPVVSNPADYMNRQRIRQELLQHMMTFMQGFAEAGRK